MIFKLFKAAPRSVRKWLGQRLRHAVREREDQHAAGLPSAKLRSEHISNARILLDRDALLDVLPKDGVVAEIGVDVGEFSERILALTTPKRLHLIDAWATARFGAAQLRKVETRLAENIRTGLVKIHRGLSFDELECFADETFDWVYLDTDHSYPSTARELALCGRKVKKGGIIAGHDFTRGNWRGYVRYGVVEAVHEFCVDQGWEIIFLTHETDRHLSFALRQILD